MTVLLQQHLRLTLPFMCRVVQSILLSVSTDVPDYKVWIADLGTTDTSGNEITDQPHVGVLFKSANNIILGQHHRLKI